MFFDRTIAPDFKNIKGIDLLKPSLFELSNSIPLYYIDVEDQDVLRVEFLFPAGEKYQNAPLVAKACNYLIKNGTNSKSAAEIANDVDQYGAFLETEVTKDSASVLLYCLRKHLMNVLPILKEILIDAAFPQYELDTYVQNSRQKHLINLEKVGFISRTVFNRELFGPNHPYGMETDHSRFDKLNREEIVQFYEKNYHLSSCKILIAGHMDSDAITLFENHFGSISLSHSNTDKASVVKIETNLKKHRIIKKGAVQSAVRIGRPLFNKTHEDYHGMQILNTILGGYFGSRLMSNIREDKGYTYGIGSAVVSLMDSGCFFISTEVGADVIDQTLTEIYFEIERLLNEPVPKEELKLVKNYLLGSFLRSVDGSFAMMQKFKNIIYYNLDYQFYQGYYKEIETISSDRIKELANAYLNKSDLLEVVVGPN